MTRDTPSSTSKPLELIVHQDERFFFGGRTGSGKTTLADKLIRTFNYRTVVVDPKHSWKFPGYVHSQQYDPSLHVRRQVFRPVDDADNGWADTVKYLTDVWSYDIPTVVYVDELTSITSPRRAPRVLSTLVRLGRERGFGTWYSSQRPKDVPSLFFSEADHWAIFDLLTKDDRDKVAGFMGDKVRGRIKKKYSFWYLHAAMAEPLLVHQK